MNRICYLKRPGVTVPKESPTVPNQSLSIREVLDRYAVNRDVPFCQGGTYDADEHFIDRGISDLDIVEQEQVIREAGDAAVRAAMVSERANEVKQASEQKQEQSSVAGVADNPSSDSES